MSVLFSSQESFNAGEFGKRMRSRVSFDKYKAAGEICENILPLPQGGFTARPGFRYIASAKDASAKPWLLPFEFSTTQAYVLEFGDSAIRFFRNQAQITVSETDASITNGSFASDITGWTGRHSGTGAITWDATYSDLSLDAAGGANRARAYQAVTTTDTNTEHVIRFKVRGDAGDEISIRIGASAGAQQFLAVTKRLAGWHTIAFTPTASPFYVEFENSQDKSIGIDDVEILSDTPHEITTPWSASLISRLGLAQSADTAYFCSGAAIRPYRLERYGHSSWSLVKVLFEDGPYLSPNLTGTTLTLGATTGNAVTVTASSLTGINNDAGFRSTDVGRLIRWEDAANKWTWMQIVEFVSTTVVRADIKGADASATTATTDWRLGEWNDTDGWPSVTSFIQQRMALAATDKEPQKFWLSKSADIENMADENVDGTVEADSSIPYRFAAQKVNSILWMMSGAQPVIGTAGGKWTLKSEGAVLTFDDIAAEQLVSGGVASVTPVDAQSRLLFVSEGARKLFELSDVFQENGVQGFDDFDLTLLNDRVLQSGVVQMAYALEPDSIIWTVREDGQAPTLTYQPTQSVIGWSRQFHGGSYQGSHAVIESVAVIPGRNGSGQFKDSTGRTEVWIAVKMEVNGSTVRYIECMEKAFNGDEDLQEDAFCVDSGLTLDNPLTITNITKADPGVVTLSDASSLSNGDKIRIVRVKGMSEINGNVFKVANKSGNTFELIDFDDVDVDTTTYTAYSAAGECRKMVMSVSGLDHLEGEEVQILADGAVQTNKTVSSGSITLDTAASLVHVGKGRSWQWKSLELAPDASKRGSTVGRNKNISDVVLSLMETGEGGISVAVEENGVLGDAAELDLRDGGSIDGDPVPFFTGKHSLGVEAGHDDDVKLVISGNTPVPATVLAVIPEIDVDT